MKNRISILNFKPRMLIFGILLLVSLIFNILLIKDNNALKKKLYHLDRELEESEIEKEELENELDDFE